jgi:lipopolysaccharide/colanic/teichoic acid biosynthesis glycosyltransferase
VNSKRLFDLVFSGLFLVILSPVLLIVASLIKISSRGPMFHRGIRTCLNGKPFRIFKFRTMVSNAEQLGEPVTAQNDERVTKIGRFLRRYKLDELPQLMNVIKGDLSVVGPRPEVPQYTRVYNEEERLILTVRPGITDHASSEFVQLDMVLGEASDRSTFDKRVQQVLLRKSELRLNYVRNQSFVGDMRIIGRTFIALLKSVWSRN